MFSFKMSDFKKTFFDAEAVVRALDKASRKALSKFGAFVRTSARGSIRRRKGSSKPGQPPHAHQGDIKKILFAYDAGSQGVVIGPIRFNKPGMAPKIMEHGGSVVIERKQKRTGRVTRKTVQVAARPFMAPAFMKELPRLPEQYRNQMNRS